MNKNFSLLIIEDNEGDVNLLRRMLQETSIQSTLEVANQLSAGIEIALAKEFDLIFLDFNLPDSSGIETFIRLGHSVSQVPVVVLSGLDDTTLALEAVRKGAQDYLVKGQFDEERLEKTIQFAIERQRIMHSLVSNEAHLRMMIQQNYDGIIVLDSEENILFSNPSASKILGKSFIQLMDRPFPFQIEPNRIAEIEIHQDSGRHVVAEMQATEIQTGEETGYLINLHDVTLRKESEARLQALITEKEVLLKEVHHRVTNNFVLITTMLRMQSQAVDDEYIKGILSECSSRLNSMAIIHRQLYESGDLGQIDVGRYVRNLCVSLIQSYSPSGIKVILDPAIESISMGINRTIPIGLVVNELVTNALKYAFRKDSQQQNRLTVQLDKDERNMMHIVVEDNGVGLPENFSIESTESLGLKIVRMLVEDQLNGQIHVSSSNGARFEIEFKIK